MKLITSINSPINSHFILEIIVATILFVMVAIKIFIRTFFDIKYEQAQTSFILKNQNENKIDYHEIVTNYFQYFNFPKPEFIEAEAIIKFDHYNIRAQQLCRAKIPKIINDDILNGYNLDYILVHLWLFKRHTKHKIKTTIQKYVAYHAYPTARFLFYFSIITKIFLIPIIAKRIDDDILRNIISDNSSIFCFITFFLDLLALFSSIFVKARWEAAYERETLAYVKANFSPYFDEYKMARTFSKQNKFTVYFKQLDKEWNNNFQKVPIVQTEKYLGPFVTIDFWGKYSQDEF